MKYKYTGNRNIIIYGVGVIKYNQEFETDQVIDHPHVKQVKPEAPKKAETKTKK